jgi:hypothetical protein
MKSLMLAKLLLERRGKLFRGLLGSRRAWTMLLGGLAGRPLWIAGAAASVAGALFLRRRATA